MNIDYRITVVIGMIILCFSTLLTKMAMKEGLSPRHTFIIFAGIAFIVACSVDIYQGEKFWEAFGVSKGPLFAYAGALLGVAALLLYYNAIGQGSISVAVPIWSLQAVGVGILGVVFLKENITDLKAIAVALAFLAIWLITRQN